MKRLLKLLRLNKETVNNTEYDLDKVEVNVEYTTSYYDLIKTIHNITEMVKVDKVFTDLVKTTGYVKGGLTYNLHKLLYLTDEFKGIYEKEEIMCNTTVGKSVFSLGIVSITVSGYMHVEPNSNNDTVTSTLIEQQKKLYRYDGSYETIMKRFKPTSIYNDIKIKIDEAIEYKYLYEEKINIENDTTLYKEKDEYYKTEAEVISYVYNNPVEEQDHKGYFIWNIEYDIVILSTLLQLSSSYTILPRNGYIFVQLNHLDMTKVANYIVDNLNVDHTFTFPLLQRLIKDNPSVLNNETEQDLDEDKYIEGVDEIIEN